MKKNVYVLLHETDFDGLEGCSIGGYVFENPEDAINDLLSNGYIEHEEWIFTKYEDGIYDTVSIVQTLLK